MCAYAYTIGAREATVRSSGTVKKPTQKARSTRSGLSLQRAGVSVSSDTRGSTKDRTGKIAYTILPNNIVNNFQVLFTVCSVYSVAC